MYGFSLNYQKFQIQEDFSSIKLTKLFQIYIYLVQHCYLYYAIYFCLWFLFILFLFFSIKTYYYLLYFQSQRIKISHILIQSFFDFLIQLKHRLINSLYYSKINQNKLSQKFKIPEHTMFKQQVQVKQPRHLQSQSALKNQQSNVHLKSITEQQHDSPPHIKENKIVSQRIQQPSQQHNFHSQSQSHQSSSQSPSLNEEPVPQSQSSQTQAYLLKQNNLLTTQMFIAQQEQYTQNLSTNKNTFIFGILLILTQIAVSLVYGLVLYTPSMDRSKVWSLSTTSYPKFLPILMNILMGMICVVGFGALFAYNKKLIWSGLALNLLICCLTIQIFFIVNNLINRIGIVSSLQQYSQHAQFYLYNFQQHSTKPLASSLQVTSSDIILPFGNTLITAFKCAIANSVAFSSILGKGGLLQLYIVVFVGTIVFQFNRQVLDYMGQDYGEGNSTFTFGGFYGLTLGLMQSIKYRSPHNTTKQHHNYTANLLSGGFSLIGTVFLIALFPVYVLHPSYTQREYLPRYLSMMSTTMYHSIASASIMSIAMSFFINQKIAIRDLINGTIAGAIAVVYPAFFIFSPIFAMIVGSTAGIVQVLVQNFIEKTVAMNSYIVNTYSFCLFGVQGILGAVFASVFRQALFNDNKSMPYSRTGYQSLNQPVILGAIAAAMGIGGGLLAGLGVLLVSRHMREDHFHDRTYFGDGEEQPFMNQWEFDQYRVHKVQKFSPGIIPFF